jgi:transposase
MVFFSAGKGGGELIDYGYKGKGVTTHLLADNGGNPVALETTSAKGDERQQVECLLDSINHLLANFSKETNLFPIFEADKGYDSLELRERLLQRRIYPLIPYRKMGKEDRWKKIASWVLRKRWQVERAIAWLQRKFRRLVARWERKLKYWKGFLNFSLIVFWADRISK